MAPAFQRTEQSLLLDQPARQAWLLRDSSQSLQVSSHFPSGHVVECLKPAPALGLENGTGNRPACDEPSGVLDIGERGAWRTRPVRTGAVHPGDAYRRAYSTRSHEMRMQYGGEGPPTEPGRVAARHRDGRGCARKKRQMRVVASGASDEPEAPPQNGCCHTGGTCVIGLGGFGV